MDVENNEIDMAAILKLIEDKKSEFRKKNSQLYKTDIKAYNAEKQKRYRQRKSIALNSNPDVIADRERIAEEKRVIKEAEDLKIAEKRRIREERRRDRDIRINAQKEKSNAYKEHIDFCLSKISPEAQEKIKACYFFPRVDVKEVLCSFKIHVQYYSNKKVRKVNEYTKTLPISLIDQAKLLLLKILKDIEKEQDEVVTEEVLDVENEPTAEELEDMEYEDFDLGDF